MPVRLFVGNLSYDTTEAELRQHFSSVGQVSYCYLPADRETGRPRGFAFVEFTDDAAAQEAISRLNNQSFRGRPLAVKEAQPRESRPPGSGPVGRPAFTPGPRPLRPPMSAGAGPGVDSGSAAPRRGNFGPDAPPRGKKGKFNRPAERGPKGPIRVKPDGRIYSTDEYGEDSADSFDGDNFATRAEPGESVEPAEPVEPVEPVEDKDTDD
jgi:cold-inducible RNA-binding protein